MAQMQHDGTVAPHVKGKLQAGRGACVVQTQRCKLAQHNRDALRLERDGQRLYNSRAQGGAARASQRAALCSEGEGGKEREKQKPAWHGREEGWRPDEGRRLNTRSQGGAAEPTGGALWRMRAWPDKTDRQGGAARWRGLVEHRKKGTWRRGTTMPRGSNVRRRRGWHGKTTRKSGAA